MAFRKIDAPSIKELFLSQMEEMILSGELKPGDKLPPERELADTMGISKTVVHEGIRELSRRGFLDVLSRKGVHVADYTRTGNLDTLFAMIRYRGGMPDRKILISLLDTRLYLECPALRILCERQDPADLAKLSEILDAVRKALDLDITDFASALFLYRRDHRNADRQLHLAAGDERVFPVFHYGLDRLLRIHRAGTASGDFVRNQ